MDFPSTVLADITSAPLDLSTGPKPKSKVSTITGRTLSPLEANLEETHKLRDTPITNFPYLRDVLVTREAQKQGVNPSLALAVAQQENDRAIPWAVSNTGDIGLMQINPHVHQVDPKILADPEMNVKYGVSILKSLLTKFKGDVDKALQAYNGSLGTPNGAKYVRAVRGNQIYIESNASMMKGNK